MLSCLKFPQNLALNKQKLLKMLYLICLYLMAFTLNIYGLLSKNKIFCIMDTFISVKSTGKVPKATICYWTQEDIEEEGEDEKICILQLLTDYITGDMIFVDFPDM